MSKWKFLNGLAMLLATFACNAQQVGKRATEIGLIDVTPLDKWYHNPFQQRPMTNWFIVTGHELSRDPISREAICELDTINPVGKAADGGKKQGGVPIDGRKFYAVVEHMPSFDYGDIRCEYLLNLQRQKEVTIDGKKLKVVVLDHGTSLWQPNGGYSSIDADRLFPRNPVASRACDSLV